MINPAKTVDASFQRALRMMEGAGYAIGDNVSVRVDPDLPFMGYTFPGGDKYTIVVSGTAVDSGMLEGLLVHEMSHIYRMKTGHPSHDGEIINEATSRIVNQGHNSDAQQKVLHDIVNHLEDLYADDISFKVFGKSRTFPVETAGRFFLSWLTPDPVKSSNPKRDGWVNAAIMLRNAFAISNMERHGIPDPEKKARRMNVQFLSGLPGAASKDFEYFQHTMTQMKENISKKEFSSLLNSYLERFVRVAEGQHPTL